MIVSIWSYSQNTSTITITSDQLKTANLIFLEHKLSLEKIDILNNQIDNLNNLNEYLILKDSINNNNIEYYKIQYDNLYKEIDIYDNRLNKYKKITFGSITFSIVTVLLCLITK